jgi:hypothetical protein
MSKQQYNLPDEQFFWVNVQKRTVVPATPHTNFYKIKGCYLIRTDSAADALFTAHWLYGDKPMDQVFKKEEQKHASKK